MLRNLQTVDSIIDINASNGASVRALVVISIARMMAAMMMIVARPNTVAKPTFCLLVIRILRSKLKGIAITASDINQYSSSFK